MSADENPFLEETPEQFQERCVKIVLDEFWKTHESMAS